MPLVNELKHPTQGSIQFLNGLQDIPNCSPLNVESSISSDLKSSLKPNFKKYKKSALIIKPNSNNTQESSMRVAYNKSCQTNNTLFVKFSDKKENLLPTKNTNGPFVANLVLENVTKDISERILSKPVESSSRGCVLTKEIGEQDNINFRTKNKIISTDFFDSDHLEINSEMRSSIPSFLTTQDRFPNMNNNRSTSSGELKEKDTSLPPKPVENVDRVALKCPYSDELSVTKDEELNFDHDLRDVIPNLSGLGEYFQNTLSSVDIPMTTDIFEKQEVVTRTGSSAGESVISLSTSHPTFEMERNMIHLATIESNPISEPHKSVELCGNSIYSKDLDRLTKDKETDISKFIKRVSKITEDYIVGNSLIRSDPAIEEGCLQDRIHLKKYEPPSFISVHDIKYQRITSVTEFVEVDQLSELLTSNIFDW